MVVYRCVICQDGIITTVRQFLFKHYLKHLRRDLNDKAIQLGITNKPNNENKFSLINLLITYSILKGV
jgi:hypothetical protein